MHMRIQKFSLVSRGRGAVGGYERAQHKVFWVFIVVFNLFYRRGPQLFISRKSLMFQRSCGGGGGSNINRPYASYRTCDFQGGPDPPPPSDTRTFHMPYMYSVYVKTVGTSSHPERGWLEGVQLWQLFSC